jgi:hypothetical protein
MISSLAHRNVVLNLALEPGRVVAVEAGRVSARGPCGMIEAAVRRVGDE